jgi:hypothetical protein
VKRLLLALALAAGSTASAEDGEVRFEAQLHLLFSARANLPGSQVLYDRTSRTFDLAPYLATVGAEQYGSTIAALRLDGRHAQGALRWTLALDTGEVRRTRAPELASTCPSSTSPTGLDVRGSLRCTPGVAAIWPVEETRLRAAEITSNGRSFDVEVRKTLLVREANASLSFGHAGFAALRAGRSRYVVGEGLIHDDYGTGLDVALDLGALGPPFELRAALFQPTRDFPRTVTGISPVMLLRADWLPSLFEHAGLFVAARHDRTSAVSELFRGALIEDSVTRLAGLAPGDPGYAPAAQRLAATLASAPTSDSTALWAGTSGVLSTFDHQRLSWTLAALRGRVNTLSTALFTLTDLPLSGAAAWLRYQVSPADWLSVSPWFLYLSGDRPPTEKARLGLPAGYGGFLGVTPYLTATNLFFGGGLSESFATHQATAPGVNGRGVIAPGLTLELGLPAEVDLTARAAWLLAEDVGPYGGKVYGTELDLTTRWTPRPWLSLGLEADLLLPGDFFGGDRAISKVIMALDLLTP